MQHVIRKALLVIVSISLYGCASYQGRTALIPQQSPDWKQRWGYSDFQTQCNQGQVVASDIVLSIDSRGYTLFYLPVTFENKNDLAEFNEKGASLYLMFVNDTPAGACRLSDVHLEKVGSGELIKPTSAEKTASYKDDRSKKYTTYCAYYFDLKNDPLLQYDLHISKEVFNCEIKPIRYKYKKGYESLYVELM